MITVYPIDQLFTINVYENKEEEKGLVQFIVKPLKYRDKNLINSRIVSRKNGDTFLDYSLSAFLTLKHSIKDIKGVVSPDGEEYKLSFEPHEDTEILTDACVEEILNCRVGYAVNFYAVEAINGTPQQLVNPVSGLPLKDIEFLPWNKEESKKK